MDEILIIRGANGWYWRRIAPNGEPIAGGLEPFRTRWNARRAARRANTDGHWTFTART